MNFGPGGTLPGSDHTRASAEQLTRWNQHFALPQLACAHGLHGPLIGVDHPDAGDLYWACPRCGDIQPVMPAQHLLAIGSSELPVPATTTAPPRPGDLRDGSLLIGEQFLGIPNLDSRAIWYSAAAGFSALVATTAIGVHPLLMLALIGALSAGILRFAARPTARIHTEHHLRANQLEPGMWVRIPSSRATQVHQVVRESNTYRLAVTLGTGETKSWDAAATVIVVELEGEQAA